jgi:hypothetical protein
MSFMFLRPPRFTVAEGRLSNSTFRNPEGFAAQQVNPSTSPENRA